MTPFEAFQLFQALKFHFNQKNYNYFMYNGKTKHKVSSFNTRKDKFFYYKLSKKTDPTGLIVSNILVNPEIWVADLFREEADKIYNDWLKRNQAITYNFQSEIKLLDPNLNNNFKVDNGQHPILLKLYRTNKISHETMAILNCIFNYVPQWDKQITDPVLWPKFSMIIRKYSPFVNFDLAKCKKILRDHFIS